jgi:nitrous oxidase accessory protein
MNFILIKILLVFSIIILSTEDANSQIVVEKYGQIKTLTEAISIAKDGDEIIVKTGEYQEGNILINKSVRLIAAGEVVIDGEGKTEVLTVTSDNVEIKGFTIVNAGISYLQENAAIKLEEVKNCVVENNTLLNNFFGVYLAKSENCIIRNNEIKSDGKTEASSGNGIHLWYCKDIQIVSNNISGHRDGIYLEFVQDAMIEKNFSEKNLRYGLHFMFSDRCVYSKNQFQKNGAGVAVMYSKNVQMFENIFNDNWGPASYGLLLKDISESLIERNSFQKNTTGVYMEGCGKSKIQNNVFEKNGWAIKLMANSMNNQFERNDFITNSFDVATNSRQNFNTFENNYYSKYKGYDLTKNGIGDVPYRPVKLYSIIVEQQPPSLVLLNSLFIELLDIAESVFPSLTPGALVDNSPSMRRIN